MKSCSVIVVLATIASFAALVQADDSPTEDYPTDYPGKDYPRDHPGKDYPTDYPGKDYPTDYPGEEYPKDYPGKDYPTEYPGKDYPRDYPGKDYPTDYPGKDYPTDYPGEEYPKDYPGEDYPKDYPGKDYPKDYPGKDYPKDYPKRDSPKRDYRPERITCEHDFEECRYAFHGIRGLPTFHLRGTKPDVPFTPRIVVKRGSPVGVLNTNRVPVEVLVDGHFRPIEDIRVHPRWTPTHFKPYAIFYDRRYGGRDNRKGRRYDDKRDYRKGRNLGSGIGHETFIGEQEKAARHQCIRVFFSNIQILNKRGNVVMNLNNVRPSERRCVVFRTD